MNVSHLFNLMQSDRTLLLGWPGSPLTSGYGDDVTAVTCILSIDRKLKIPTGQRERFVENPPPGSGLYLVLCTECLVPKVPNIFKYRVRITEFTRTGTGIENILL